MSVTLFQVVGIVMVVMIGLWLNLYFEGFAWDGSLKEFNLHPLCMVCGIIFIYGEGMFLDIKLLYINIKQVDIKLLVIFIYWIC